MLIQINNVILCILLIRHVLCYNTTCLISTVNGEKHADCSHKYLKTIPNDLPVHVTALNLAWNQLTHIDANLLSSYTFLKQIILTGNRFLELNNISQHVTNVTPKWLALDNVSNQDRTQTLHEIIFCSSFYKHVTHLSIRANGITRVELSCFHCVPNLQFLAIGYNQITHIDTGIPVPLTSGFYYKLDTTPLPYRIFPRLRVLDLSYITYTSQSYVDVWGNATVGELFLDDEEQLYKEDLDIPERNGTTFYNAFIFEKLYLTHFIYLSAIWGGGDAFTVKSLKFLDVSYNPGEKQLSISLISFPLLQVVRCKSCSFRTIDVGALDIMPNVLELDITGNYLGSCENNFPGIFKPLDKLEYLYLGTNELTYLPTDSFSTLVSLKYLDLSGNYITFVAIVLQSPSLAYLNVYGNRLKDDFITKNLRENISHLSQMSEKNVLILIGPELECECISEEFLKWTSHKYIDINNGTNCSFNEQIVPLKDVGSILQNSYTCVGIHVPVLAASLVIGVIVLVLTIILYRYRIYIRWGFYRLRHFISREQYLQNTAALKFDVYISVANDDLAWTKDNILSYLEDTQEMKVYLYERDSIGGWAVYDNIFYGISNSAFVIVIVSPHFVRDEMKDWELSMAVASGKSRVAIITIDEIVSTDIKLSGILKYLMLPSPKVPVFEWNSGTCGNAILLSALEHCIQKNKNKYRRGHNNAEGLETTNL